eukprot:TRINITY_DN15390_c0_g1_i2.p1 TRINITY_DN15390_c0_g1~~TRINITY_DN15390_c0_g1_i2.p1  ORF type:complete len:366 (+),score=72.82 TRINITY_DN15390_c0_g1_i2:59-1099(+)
MASQTPAAPNAVGGRPSAVELPSLQEAEAAARAAADAASSWFSGVADSFSTAVASLGAPEAPTQEAEADWLEAQDYDWLPPREREAMLHLRARAELRAQDAPGEALSGGLRRMRSWAEAADWPDNIDAHWQKGVTPSAASTGSASPTESSKSSSWGDSSPRWKRLGFQSRNPRTDFRTGMLAVDCLVYLCERKPEDLQQLCLEACPAALDYPLAVAAINLTQLLAWYLGLVGGPNPAGPGDCVGRLDDMMQLHAFAKLCAESAQSGDGDGAAPAAFCELHSEALLCLHRAWRSKKTMDPKMNMSCFGELLHATLGAVDSVLREMPLEKASELRSIRDRPLSLRASG